MELARVFYTLCLDLLSQNVAAWCRRVGSAHLHKSLGGMSAQARILNVGVLLVFAIMANALYLRQVRAFWSAHQADPAGTTLAATAGRTNIWAGIGAAVILTVITALAGETAEDIEAFFGSSNGCSSKPAVDTVAKLAREQMTKQGLAYLGIDIPSTQVTLDAIRTRDDRGRKTECAATIKYDVRLGPNAKPDTNRQSLSDFLQADITYTVEKTDDGKNIYVTVVGLKQ